VAFCPGGDSLVAGLNGAAIGMLLIAEIPARRSGGRHGGPSEQRAARVAAGPGCAIGSGIMEIGTPLNWPVPGGHPAAS
jgi:hypothetical protein